jgi:hypothetical protein
MVPGNFQQDLPDFFHNTSIHGYPYSFSWLFTAQRLAQWCGGTGKTPSQLCATSGKPTLFPSGEGGRVESVGGNARCFVFASSIDLLIT